MKNKLVKKIILSISIITLTIFLCITGVKMINDQRDNEYKKMENIATSKIATEAIWRTLRGFEDDNLNGKRVVKKFDIVKGSIYKNPINGYELKIYVNDDRRLNAGVSLATLGAKPGTFDADFAVSPKLSELVGIEEDNRKYLEEINGHKNKN